MDQSTVFPAFIRATYDDSAGGFPAFERAAQSSANRARQMFEGAFAEIGQVAQRALSTGLSVGGGLNLNVGQYRQAAAEASAYEQSLRTMLKTATALAHSTGDTSAQTRKYLQALGAQVIEAERATGAANAQVSSYTRLQAALDVTADKNSRLAQSYRMLYAEQAAQARADLAARQWQASFNSVVAPGLGRPGGAAAASAGVFQAAARETAQYAREAANLRAQLDPMFAAQQRFDQEMVRAERLLAAGAISAREYAQAQLMARQTLQATAQQVAGTADTVAAASRSAVYGASAQRFAYVQLGQQMSDVAIQAQLGVNPLIILTQQGSQAAFALSMLGMQADGTQRGIGRFAAFMAGPWGAAIFGGITIIGLLTGALARSGRQSLDTRNKISTLRDALFALRISTDAARKALFDYNEEQRKARETTDLGIEQSYAQAKAALEEAAAIRERMKAKFEEANARSIDPTLAGEGGFNPGATAAAGYAKQLGQYDRDIDRLRQAARNLGIEIASNAAKVAVDPVAAINDQYDRMADAAKQAAAGNDKLNASLRETLIQIEKSRKGALDAQRDRDKVKTVRGDLAEFIMPVTGRITSGFGARAAPIAGASKDHRGIDIAAPFGTAVKAPQVGTVKAIGFDPKLGKYVIIDHGAGTTTRFGHLSDNSLVREGQIVSQGDIIGRVGSTGKSTGNHLHYGVYQNGKAVDPRAGQFGIDSIASLEKAEREAAQAAKDLRKDLEGVLGELDPVRAAAERYAETLEKIASLQKVGKASGGLSAEEAEQYRYRLALKRIDDAAQAQQEANQRVLEQYGADVELATGDIRDQMVDAGRAGAQAFRDEGLAAAQAIAQIFGGKVGGAIGSFIGLMQGSNSGNFNSVGGKLGGALTLLNSGGGKRYLTFGANLNATGGPAADPRKNYQVMQAINPTFGDGFRGGTSKFGDDLSKQFKKVFGDKALSPQLGEALGSAFAGAQFGGSIGNALTGVLGVKGSKLGSQMGGALGGALAGPVGSIVGGVLGSVVGGAFKKTKTGSATIGVGSNGELIVTGLSGSSKKLRDAANDNAGSALTSIERIAEALGASVNSSRGSVSIGFRDKNARVDPTGSGITKTKKGAIDFGDDIEAAVKYATLDLIKDGVLEGLRAGTQLLLTKSKDLEAGLDKALKFESIFTRLKAYTDPVGAALDTLDKEFKSLIKISQEAGATAEDMAQLEQLYGFKRKEAIEEAAESTIGSLRELLRDLTVGDNGRSLRDRRAAALAEYDPLRQRVAAGDQTAFDAYAQAAQTLLDIQRQISGSGTDYFALQDEILALTKSAITGVENVTSIATGRDSIFKQADLKLAVDNAPVTGAIDRMAASIVAQLNATNQNLGTLIRLQGAGGSANDYFQNIANF